MGSAERSAAAGEDNLLDVARAAVKLALRKGARESAGGAYRVRSVEVQWRDGQLEKISESTTRGLGLELYVDGRYSAVSTSDLRPEAVERFVEDAVALTRKLSVDPHRYLPDPKLYQGRAEVDLDLEDPRYGEVDALRRLELARQREQAAPPVAALAATRAVATASSPTS